LDESTLVAAYQRSDVLITRTLVYGAKGLRTGSVFSSVAAGLALRTCTDDYRRTGNVQIVKSGRKQRLDRRYHH
jgi:hypothetical protein